MPKPDLVAEVRERHFVAIPLPGSWRPKVRSCDECEDDWPCVAIRAVDEIERLREIEREVAALRASFTDAMHALEVVAALRSGSKRDLQDFARQERKKIIQQAGCGKWFRIG